jgi:hypothetical protein
LQHFPVGARLSGPRRPAIALQQRQRAFRDVRLI